MRQRRRGNRLAHWYRQLGEKCSGLWNSADTPGSHSAGGPLRARRLRIEPLEVREVLSATLAFDTTAYEQDASSKKLQVNYTVSGDTTSSAFDIALVAMVGASPVTLMTGTVASGQAPGSYSFDFSDDVAVLLSDASFKLVLDPAHSVMGSSPETAYVGSFIDDNGVVVIQGTSSADSVTPSVSSGVLSFTLNSVNYSYTLAGAGSQPAVTAMQARLREGNDTLDNSGTSVTISAWGGAGADSLTGGGGSNSLHGNAGNDTLLGGSGSNFLSGEDDDDTITGGSGANTLSGGAGNDTISGDPNSTATNSIDGGEGDDLIYAGLGTNTITADEEDDTVYWATGDGATAVTGSGLGGEPTNLILDLSNSNQTVAVSNTAVVVGSTTVSYSGLAAITVNSGSGADSATVNFPASSPAIPTLTVNLGSGSDTLTVNPATGNNTVSVSNSSVVVDSKTVSFSGVETIAVDAGAGTNGLTVNGTSSDDSFSVSSSSVTMGSLAINYANFQTLAVLGNNGVDDYSVTGGASTTTTLTGGAGGNIYTFAGSVTGDYVISQSASETATLSFYALTTAASVNLSLGTQQTVRSGLTLTLSGSPSIVSLAGSNYNDTLVGNNLGNTIQGLGGADTITGGTGNDSISGGAGGDTITSGGGVDSLNGGDGDDTITGGSGTNTIGAGDGDDTVYGGSGTNIIGTADFDGGEGNDADIIYANGTSTITADDPDNVYWSEGDGATTLYGQNTGLGISTGNSNQSIAITNAQVVVNSTTISYTGVDTLSVTTGSGNDDVSITLPASAPALPVITLSLAGGTDTVDIVGSSNGDTFLVGTAAVTANGKAINISGAEDVDINPGAGNDTVSVVQPTSGTLLADSFTDNEGLNTLVVTSVSGGSISGGYNSGSGNTVFTAGSYTITGSGFRSYDLNAQNVTLNNVRIDHYYDVDATSITLDGDIYTNGTITPGDRFTLINNVVGNALSGNFDNAASVSVGTLAYEGEEDASSHDLVVSLILEDFGDEIKVGPTSAATHDDPTIPRFAASPTIWAIDDGDWFDPDTWSAGRAPTTNDVAFIPQDTTISYDEVSATKIKALDIWGSLEFADDVSTELIVGTLTVLPLGTLQIGTSADPIAAGVSAKLTIANQALDTAGIDPKQYGTGLLALGKVDIHGSEQTETWMRLGANVVADGNSAPDTIVFAEAVPESWEGKKIVLPDTRQPLSSWSNSSTWTRTFGEFTSLANLQGYQTETVTIVSVDGNTVTLAEDLQYSHLGQSYYDQVAEETVNLYPHAALLDRNVIIRSENPAGTRGHTFYTGRADVDIEYVQYKDLGRTNNDVPLNNSSFNVGTQTWTIGTNQIGRYAVHFHHLMGPENSNPTTPDMLQEQFHFIGNTVQNSKKWAVAVHDTSYGVLEDNVIFAAQGAGFVTEEGTEVGNRFIHNITISMRGNSQDDHDGLQVGVDDYARGGEGFWFRRMGNIVRDNVSTDNSYAAYMVNGYYQRDNMAFPDFPGANPDVDGTVLDERELSKVTYLPTTGSTPLVDHWGYDDVFANNEAYGMSAYGLWAAYTVGDNNTDHGTSPDYESVFNKLVMWNTGSFSAAWPYHTNRVTFKDLVILGNTDALNVASFGTRALRLEHYENFNLTISGAHIEGYHTGIELPTSSIFKKGGDTTSGTLIENAYLKNRVNIANSQPEPGSRGNYTKLDNVTFAFPSFATTPSAAEKTISMFQSESPEPYRRDLTVLNILEVEGFNYDTYVDEDFQVYFSQQAPTGIDYHASRYDWFQRGPVDENPWYGAPLLVADHDNEYYLDNYGVAFAGFTAPGDALDGTWDESAMKITGLVGSYKSPLEDFDNVDAHVQLTTPWDGAEFEDQYDNGAPYIVVRYNVFGSVDALVGGSITQANVKLKVIHYDTDNTTILSTTIKTLPVNDGVVWTIVEGGIETYVKPGHYKLVTYIADQNGDEIAGTSGSEAEIDIIPHTITLSSPTQAEGDAPNSTYFIFTITLSGPESADGAIILVDYTTVDGTATVANSDYVATSGTLTFAPGTTTRTITVTVVGDDDDEGDETFSIQLSNPRMGTFTGYELANSGLGTGTIQDDDP